MQKLEHVQTKDRIASMIRDGILSGNIGDGAELAQEQLAEQLQVSRMPVREALQMLEGEGLLERLPNRHMRVAGLSERSVRQNLRMVAAAEVELILAQLPDKRGAFAGLEVHDCAKFHGGIGLLTGNPYTRQVHKRLLDGYPRHIWQRMCDCMGLVGLNKEIALAIAGGDESEIRAAVRWYYDALADALLADMKGVNGGD